MKFPKACIVVFAKEPVAGKVKTRLIPALGAEGAKDLHVKLMQRIFSLSNKLTLCPVQLWVDKNPQSPAFDEFTGEHKVQLNTDLGLRMHDAACQVLERFQSVVIIGSDCPDMSEAYLEQALLALEDETIDLVFGPASDGGYVLIGMKQPTLEVFQEIDWGTEKVMQQTREKLSSNNFKWRELPELFDIDRPEDLIVYSGSY